MSVGEVAVRCPVRSRFWVGTAGYAGVVMLLVVVSFLTEFTVGPAVYIAAVLLALPVGVVIYPALWVNAFAVAVLVHVLPGGEQFDGPLTLAGVVVVFGAAAVGNAWVLREVWRGVRRGGSR